MGRLIDADVMLEELKDKEVVIAQQNIADWIDEQPTVDAEPVRYGKWIAQDETRTKFMCSECNAKNYGGHEKYCPNCGARMDGE